MESIIPLIVLLVLAVPIIVILSLFSLASKLRRAAEQIDLLMRRLAHVELDLNEIKRRLVEPAASSALEPPSQNLTPEARPSAVSAAPAEKWERATSPLPVSAPEAARSASQPPLVPPPLPPSLIEQPTLVPPPLAPPLVASAAAEPEAELVGAAAEPEAELVGAAAEPEAELVGAAASSVPPSPALPALNINWEQFMGVKLFAWIGGFALFLGVAFFIKYSFERNLIPPELRVAIGFLIGLGLVIGGVLMKRRELEVTSQSLCATGVVILYAVTFACRSIYHFRFFGQLPTFLLMVLITVAAFTLAVRLNAMVVAILGLVGGFLTPLLLSTGEDNPMGLFTYVALLDAGLIAVALRRQWQFLIVMGAIGTVFMQLGWVGKFFQADKVFIAMAVFLGFDALFLAAFLVGEKLKQANDWLSAAAIGLPFVTLGFVFYLLSFADLRVRPAVFFSFALGADLCLLGLVLVRHTLHQAHMAAGAAVFLLLAVWTGQTVTGSLLYWALGLYLLFAVLHTLFPVVLARLRPDAARTWWGHLFPPVALLLMLIPMLKEQTVSLVIWPAVLLVDALAVGLAVLTASILSILAVLLLTLVLTAVWVLKIPAELTGLPILLTVVAGFSLFFFVIGIVFGKRLLLGPGQKHAPSLPLDDELAILFGGRFSNEQLLAQIPAFSAILPFLLLMMVSVRMPLANPSPVFGLALLLVVLLLGLALASQLDALVPVSLACVLALEGIWHQNHFQTDVPWIPLIWYAGFYALYTVFPFFFAEKFKGRILPWAVSALAGPVQFLLIYRVVSTAFPNSYLGLLPAAMSVPMLLALAQAARDTRFDSAMRLNLLAWFGGSALFFITLVFPIQFDRQWITIGWALEGLALIWLFHRVPHPGLRATGSVLLAIAFARLALNPAVLDYHRSSATRVFNWYLYAYGIVTVCLMLGARLLAPPRDVVLGTRAPPVLYTLGTILAFLLVNIEIADYFAEGTTLTFQFSGNLARDMTYSMAWGLFGLVLLIVGIWKRLAAVRYSALGLLVATLLKLFFHDLSQLGQLYRIGAFMVVAVILIVASFLYQRFVSFEVNDQNVKAS
jgi:uncharacterized membrane protein